MLDSMSALLKTQNAQIKEFYEDMTGEKLKVSEESNQNMSGERLIITKEVSETIYNF